MAYQELIKNFQIMRDYIRAFSVYGYQHRSQYDLKSARSYDDGKRRMESWFRQYLSSRQEAGGKVVFLSADSRKIQQNPLHEAFKTKSFTAKDITLFFYLMDLLEEERPLSLKEILAQIGRYQAEAGAELLTEESTVRKKLREYETIGLVEKVRKGKHVLYTKRRSMLSLGTWKEAIAFYAETDSMGVIGSYLLDRMEHIPDYFGFKHRFFLHALDSEVLYRILQAFNGGNRLRIRVKTPEGGREFTTDPVRVYISTQNGRQYLLGWNGGREGRFLFFRLDRIQEAQVLLHDGEPAVKAAVYGEEMRGKDGGSKATGSGEGRRESGKDGGSEATGSGEGRRESGKDGGSEATGSGEGRRESGKDSGSEATGTGEGRWESGKEEHDRTFCETEYQKIRGSIWGVSLGDGKTTEDLEMVIAVGGHEDFILQRLNREKRCGKVEQAGEGLYRFRASVFDAREMLPWIRTFIGRIVSLKCSNPEVTETFFRDLEAMDQFCGGETDVIS